MTVQNYILFNYNNLSCVDQLHDNPNLRQFKFLWNFQGAISQNIIWKIITVPESQINKDYDGKNNLLNEIFHIF